MIVLSSPLSIQNEIAVIHQLFEAGLELFHIRKPHMTQLELQYYIGQIREQYHSKIAVHQHFETAMEFNIHRLHFTEKNKEDFEYIRAVLPIRTDWVFSASTHSIEGFNALPVSFQYAFLSPIFESISKPGYKSSEDILKTLKRRNNFQTRLVGLGGIDSSNCEQLYQSGFDDVALLGALWNTAKPVEEFKKCLRKEHHD